MYAADGFHGLIEEQSELVPIANVNDHYCFAPMVIGDHMVFEALAHKPLEHKKQASWYELGIGSLSFQTNELKITPMGIYERLSHLKDYGHLSGLSDGNKAYFPINRKDISYLKVSIGQRPNGYKLRWLDEKFVPPSFNCQNALFVGNRLFVCDRTGDRLVAWDLETRSVPNTISIPRGRDSRDSTLFAQPVAFGNILGLFFKDEIAFVSI